VLDRSRVREVFAAAVALPALERAAYLDAACAADAPLRAEVESLLSAFDRRSGFMSSPTIGAPPSTGTEAPGTRIGPYVLLHELGSGGFGVVYAAEQESPVRRRVALKIIKPGMDTRAVIARFEAERQALAMMDHPHIATVMDARATETGRPYFVMEFVDGVPITTYAERNALSVHARLALFAQVCHAVQHAHTKGVIHRDLKPGNVLVTTKDDLPHIKVIDFGIAKAVDHRAAAHTAFTEAGQFVGTPEYMSPEQAGGERDVDTRTDVYGLGVLLYELLTGDTPFPAKELRSAAYDEVRRIICEVDPPKPSTRLSGAGTHASTTPLLRADAQTRIAQVRGDLDWIVMKAIDKDRSRRYDTPGALAADVHHHLAGEPVSAAPPSASYRARKFVRRNRVLVGAGGAVSAALVLGIFGTSIGLFAAKQATATAEASAETASREAARANGAELEAEERRATAEYDAYIANIESAYSALRLNDPTRLRTRLDACPPERRHWEWKYLNAASDTSIRAMVHPRRNVQNFAFSPDGAWIASTSGDGKVRIWDYATGTELAVMEPPGKAWGMAAFSPDGSKVCAASNDGRVWEWDAHSHALLRTLEGHTAIVNRLYYLKPDGRILTSSLDGTARVWDAQGSAFAVLARHDGAIWDMWPSPDARLVVTGGHDHAVKVWDTRTNTEVVSLHGHTDRVNCVRWNPTGDRVVSASDDATTRIWNIHDGTEVARFTGHTRVSHTGFSPDGTMVVSVPMGGDPVVWDVQTGDVGFALTGHTNEVLAAGFSADGRTIFTKSTDNTVRLWDATDGSAIARLCGHIETPWTARFAPDGRHVVTGGDATLRVWPIARTPDQPIITSARHGSEAVRLSHDERTLLEVGDGRVRLIDLASGTSRPLYEGRNVTSGATFSPDGTRAAAAYGAGIVQVWNIADGREVLTLTGHSDYVNSISYSPDGARIATASDDRTARVWDANSGQQLLLLPGHTRSVNSAEFDQQGTRIVTASGDQNFAVWDAATGALIRMTPAHDHAVMHATFDATGTRILTTSSEYHARVWNADTGARLLTLKGHEHVIFGGMFSPDGSRIVTASLDGTARLWDAQTGRQILSLTGERGGVHTARFTPDGSKLLLGTTEGRAWILDTVPRRERMSAAHTK
jgi:WD40 repeat protein/serine/threonine protein kinase